MHMLQCFIRYMHHVGMQFVTDTAKRPTVTMQQLSTIRCKRLVRQALCHDVTHILCARHMQQTDATIGLSQALFEPRYSMLNVFCVLTEHANLRCS